MRIMLTGAAGKLGRAVRQAAAGRHELVCVDIESGDDGEVRQGTFTDLDFMRDLMTGCDALVHTAALHGGNAATHTPLQFTEVNVLGFQGLLELAVELGVRRVVFSSSMEVVIGRQWLSGGMAVLDEQTPPSPDWIYPLNKWQCELLGQYYHRNHGMTFTALRYMGFGYAEVLNPDLLARMVATEDVARANLLAAEREDVTFDVLHIGCRTPLTNDDIVSAQTDPGAVVDRHWPGAWQVLQREGVEMGHKRFWPVTRIDRARAVLGWEPQVGFADYLHSLGWSG